MSDTVWGIGVCELVSINGKDLCLLQFATYPSGPFKHLSIDDPQFFLLQAVFQVLGPTSIVDKDGQQHHGSLEEEVQWRVEVKEEKGEGSNQNSSDLACEHMEHVVSEFQDEGHW